MPIRADVLSAMSEHNSGLLDTAVLRLLKADEPCRYRDLLHLLLVSPDHHCHQQIAMALQRLGDPETIPYVRQVFTQGFDYLDYTCSESAAIAKWFSHLLWNIGTPEALALIKEYARHPDEGIRDEMQYRLKRIMQQRLKRGDTRKF